MAAKTAEFCLTAKTPGFGIRRADMHHRFPKGAPDIKADRGRQAARIHRKTAFMLGFGAAARSRRPRKNCFCLRQNRFTPLLISTLFLSLSRAACQQLCKGRGCCAQHGDATLIPQSTPARYSRRQREAKTS
jgi:hypothetical protein